MNVCHQEFVSKYFCQVASDWILNIGMCLLLSILTWLCVFAIDRVASGTANQPFTLRLSPVVWLQVLQIFNVQTDVKIRYGSRGFKILIQLLATDQIWQK